jgi:hypothetical protein
MTVLICCQAESPNESMAAVPLSPDDPIEIGKRLKRLRYAFGYGDSPTRWGEWIATMTGGEPISKGQWIFYEKGERWIHPLEAIRVCVATGVTTEWIYRAVPRGIDAEVLEKINATPPAEKLVPARKPSTPGKKRGLQ